MNNNFRVLLALQGKTVNDVHEATRISKTTLTDLFYCRAKNPQLQTVMKIANYLDVTIDDLFNESLIPSV